VKVTVKTRMNRVPNACILCPYFTGKKRLAEAVCYAKGANDGFGTSLSEVKISYTRPIWCPLVTTESLYGQKRSTK